MWGMWDALRGKMNCMKEEFNRQQELKEPDDNIDSDYEAWRASLGPDEIGEADPKSAKGDK